MQATEKDTAYFLHQSPYRDNSAIVHLFTKNHGKVAFILSGLKSKKQGKKAFLQPCRSLSVDYQLKAGLSKLAHIEFTPQNNQSIPTIDQFLLYQYVHELLLAILPEKLPVPTLYQDYQAFLSELSEKNTHAALRHIELALITAFGGLPTLTQTEDTQQAIDSSQTYWFYPDKGLFSQQQLDENIAIKLSGIDVNAFQHVATYYLNQTRIDNETIAQGAKTLSTFLTSQLLNGKTLKTKKIFHSLQKFM